LFFFVLTIMHAFQLFFRRGFFIFYLKLIFVLLCFDYFAVANEIVGTNICSKLNGLLRGDFGCGFANLTVLALGVLVVLLPEVWILAALTENPAPVHHYNKSSVDSFFRAQDSNSDSDSDSPPSILLLSTH